MRNCPSRSAALLVGALLCAGVAACGSAAGTGNRTASPSPTGAPAGDSGSAVPAGGYLHKDEGSDSDDTNANRLPQDNTGLPALYGPRASAAAARPIEALVRRYYAAALAGDAQSACALLGPGVRAGLVATQSRSSTASASACSAALAPLLAQQRQHLLAEEPASMTITAVYARGGLGLVAFGFRRAPEADILIEREGARWLMGAVFDDTMT